MIDHQWIRNLAASQFVNGQWRSPEANTNLIIAAFEVFLSELEDAVTSYNHFSTTGIGLFPVKDPETGRQTGILLVRGSTQIQLNFETMNETPRLSGKIISTKSFQVTEQNTAPMTAENDAFGAILWRNPQKSLWTTEQLIRKILVFLLEKSV